MITPPIVLTRSLVLASAIFALTACQTASQHPSPHNATQPANSAARAAASQAWASQTLAVLKPEMLAATQGRMTGAARLKVVLDPQGTTLACSAVPASLGLEQKIPANEPRTDTKRLTEELERQCWQMIFPRPDASLIQDGTLEVIAPIVVRRGPGSAAFQQWLTQRDAQAYLRDVLFRGVSVEHVGQALVQYQAQADGNVQGCVVTLAPHPVQPDVFVADSRLQAALTARCNRMNLAQLPGFAPDPNGYVVGISRVDYAPWQAAHR